MHDGQDSQSSSEPRWIEVITGRVGSSEGDEIWIGDDTAVVDVPATERLLFSTDLVAEGVHFDLSICTAADVGWKAMAANLSDVAAMGGRPLRAVVSIAGAGSIDLDALYDGLLDAARCFHCPIVGGDCSAGAIVVISIAMIGEPIPSGPVLRSGAQIGDGVFLTGPLGASAAGLRILRGDPTATGNLVDAHRRPVPRLSAGAAAARAGASSMMDISDGLGIDLHRLARASNVGIAIHEVPKSEGATFAEALGGGEDYELVFTAASAERVFAAFDEVGVVRPLVIGKVVDRGMGMTIGGADLPPLGYEHRG